MKECKEIKTTIYELGNKWFVEIDITKDLYESWLWHCDYDIKMYVIGSKKIGDYNWFIGIVNENIDDYMKVYKEKYMF